MKLYAFALTEIIELELFSNDSKWAYIVQGDMKYALPIDKKYNILNEAVVVDDMIVEYPEELFENLYYTSQSGDITTFTIYPSEEQFRDLFDSTIDYINEICAVTPGADPEIIKPEIEVSVKNGTLFKQVFKYKMKHNLNGSYATITVDLEFTKFDDEVVVTPPEGYLDFPEYDDSEA